jgi:DNA-binding MarR family transcriptional regulator
MIGIPINMDESIRQSHELRLLTWQLARIGRRELENALQETGVSITGLQFGALMGLMHEGPATITEMSRRFGLDPSTLVATVDTLEGKGLVARERDPADRRRYPVSLTLDGRQLVHQMANHQRVDELGRILASFGTEKSERLIALLRELIGLMENGDQFIDQVDSRLKLLIEEIE